MKKKEVKTLTIELELEHKEITTREIPYPTDLPFTMATDVAFEILNKFGASAMAIYLTILKHRNIKNNKCFPSIALIAKESGLSEKTVKRVLTDLNDNDYLIINSGMRGISSNYYFPHEWFYQYFQEDVNQRKASRRKGKEKSITETRKTKADLEEELRKTNEKLTEANRTIKYYHDKEIETSNNIGNYKGDVF